MGSLNKHRLDENPLEARFLEMWEDPKYSNTLSYILSSRPNEPEYVTDNEVTVAATVIQWLGSPVGQCFLQDALGIDVQDQLDESLRVK